MIAVCWQDISRDVGYTGMLPHKIPKAFAGGMEWLPLIV